MQNRVVAALMNNGPISFGQIDYDSISEEEADETAGDEWPAASMALFTLTKTRSLAKQRQLHGATFDMLTGCGRNQPKKPLH